LLLSFNSTDGATPEDSLISDAAGNFYGTAAIGGVNNSGVVFELSPNGGGWTETVLHSFNSSGGDGSAPFAGVIFDAAGNLYGTTFYGGGHGHGAVYELMPQGGGNWSETVLHSFNPNGADGLNPQAGLIADAAGHLFGTTSNGGKYNVGTMFEMLHTGSGGWIENVYSFDYNGSDGANPEASLISDAAGNFYGTTVGGGNSAAGTVFELSPNGSGGWTEEVLYSFGEGLDGTYPEAGLIFDAAGNLYGTTEAGGIHRGGMVFELSPNGSGDWTETVLHSFGAGSDGSAPYAGQLIFDRTGNLYGTTSSGGTNFYGIAFELSPNGSGGWTETVLHSFGAGTDGASPPAGLIWDGAGNLYGTTYAGGTSNVGTVFELSPNGSGGWTETVLYSFNSNGSDGNYPYAGLVFDRAGNLYGTTYLGGTYNIGTVFELSPNGSGGWTETVLHSFINNYSDGAYPYAGLIFDSAGNLYGTTAYGGIYYYGTAFEFSPNGSGGWTETVLYSSFGASMDGLSPNAGLIMDRAGNLYGTTVQGGIGTSAAGTVFEIAP
jgi:uncharacterized repeat protein (TIGR03803 family)